MQKKFLSQHSLFGGLDGEELNLVMSLMKKVVYEKGETILEQGKINDKIYFIFSGSVAIIKKSEKDKTFKTIAILENGQNFGEMELIDIQPCVASVTALERTVLYRLSNKDLFRIQNMSLSTYTMLIMNLAREISRRLRKMDELAAELLPAD